MLNGMDPLLTRGLLLVLYFSWRKPSAFALQEKKCRGRILSDEPMAHGVCKLLLLWNYAAMSFARTPIQDE